MALIIIVDDSDAVRSHIKQTLEAGGHQVIEAENGNVGLEKILAAKTPALVISDYNMPGYDGIAMLTKVKEALGPRPFPIFMLTTETSESLKTAGKEVGVIAWINKPFSPEKLILAVNKVVNKQQGDVK